MEKIRRSVFETNSSSTHSICIATDVSLTIPESIYFGFGEFGWQFDTLRTVEDKASYLYTDMISMGRDEQFDDIMSVLEKRGIKVTTEEKVYRKYEEEDDSYLSNGGYVVHSHDLHSFVNCVTGDETMLMNYLFSDLSFVLTGNDNSDDDVDIIVDYPHEEFYKGN